MLAVIMTAGVAFYFSTITFSKKISVDVGGRRLKGAGQTIDFFPVTSRAVAFGRSSPVKSLHLSPFNKSRSDLGNIPSVNLDPNANNVAPRDTEEVHRELAVPNAAKQSQEQQEDREINKINREQGRTIDPNVVPSRDGALSNENRFQNASPIVLPTPTVSFEGISFAETVALGQGFLPPDTVGEAGPNHFVQAVNVAFRVWDKSGNPLTPVTSLGSLFSALPPTPCRSSIDGDPIVIYDQLADRWLISQMCWQMFPRHQLIAVSQTADPTGSYFLYDFVMPNTKINDYPKFGVWPDGYYMCDNQFDKTGNFFRGAGFFAFDRAKMLAGDPSASYVFFDSCPTNLNCKVFGGLPSDLDGFIPPPPGAPNTFAFFTADEYSDPQGDGIRLFDFRVDYASPQNSTLTERVGSPMTVAAFDPLIPMFIPQPQVISTRYLDPISDRLMNRLSYRNFGGRESLILTHTVDTSVNDQGGVRYYQLDRSSLNAPFTIAEQQTFSPDTHSRWMASGAMNYVGDTAIGYSVSSTTIFPSVYYAARFATDPPGSGLFQGEQIIASGSGTQSSSTQRWGDYSDITVDPSDDCSFWYTQEYYVTSGSAPWRTRIAKFAPRPCPVSPRGTIQGTITSCPTGLPLAGVSLEANGGFERLTPANGNYSLTVLPGIYSITAIKHGYTVASGAGIVVSNGGTATQDFCISPIATFNRPTAAVTTGNLIIEPNECNLVNIPITNTGASAATSVLANLSTSTLGVTIVSAISQYPDIAAGGGTQTNLTPFQIRTDNTVACFSNIDLKLTLQFAGGGSPAEINFRVPVGQPAGPNYVFTALPGGGTIPATGTYVPRSRDDLAVAVEAPFAFSLYGKPIAPGQVMSVHQYGVIEVVPLTLSNPFSINSRLPATVFESPIAVLLPYWDGLSMRQDSVTGAGIFTETTGTAPNRTFMIEWRGRNNPANPVGPIDTNFAVFFREYSDNFDFVYAIAGSGPAAFGALASVGVQGLSYGTNFTQFSYHAPVLSNGLRISAARPAPICFQGSGECGITARRPFDFDGDGKTDISVFRPNGSTGAEWWYQRSIDGQVPAAQFGVSTDIPVPADYTADGKTDMAFFRPSTREWFILRSEDWSYYAFPFGLSGDIPVPADYDGDNKADIAVYRPSTHYWFILRSSDGVTLVGEFGLSADLPVPADYDGDGKADIAQWRPNGMTGGEWWGIKSSTNGLFAASFGSPGDKAVPGDYTGDRKADMAVWRPSNGNWFILRSEDFSFFAFPWGASGDLPAPGDYDGDGKTDASVFRPASATWFVNRSTSGPLITGFGLPTDVPVPGAFVR